MATIPADVPYITADPGLAAHWARRMPADGALRVGLVWASGSRPWQSETINLERHRRIGLAALAPLAAVHGVRFVSLQKGPASREAEAHGGLLDLFDPMHEVDDFADTAAILANLDLVIGVDTSVPHLAAAMGKPVFLLDRYHNCWRWFSGREDSPWHPTLRIFRQQRSGDWGPVVERVTRALAEMVVRVRNLV